MGHNAIALLFDVLGLFFICTARVGIAVDLVVLDAVACCHHAAEKAKRVVDVIIC
jgi:hypothetical protein